MFALAALLAKQELLQNKKHFFQKQYFVAKHKAAQIVINMTP